MTRALRLNDIDDVAIVLDDTIAGDDVLGVAAIDTIGTGHKIALRPIRAGDVVRKYGQMIGIASRDIAAGEHVHSHNMEVGSGRSGSTSSHAEPTASHTRKGTTFMGYRRANGSVGTRNFVGIISSVNCSATVSRRIAASFAAMEKDWSDETSDPGFDGVVAFTHSSGCGMSKTGEGIDTLERTLAGYARQPNLSGVLVIGLGCEVAQVGDLLSRHDLVESHRLRTLVIQDAGGTAAAIEQGKAMVSELIAQARTERRTECPISELTLGLQCGGSDGWSGVTANPALGVAADLLIAEGGTAILSETPEIYGAEHLLLSRAANPDVAEALQHRLQWWEAYAERNNASLDNNPSPGNKAGGLTTIYEKSLGAVAKAGGTPLMDVRLYAEPAQSRGLVFMDSPGYDPCSATGQIAAGANILAFTTGRGSAFGSKPSPCLKIASNAVLAARMSDDIDIDCSPILEGMSVEEAGQRIFDALIDTASGRPTKSERLGLGDYEFVPWQLGAWM